VTDEFITVNYCCQRRTEGGGDMPPKPWIKKIKTQLPRYAYLDALAVAMALSH